MTDTAAPTPVKRKRFGDYLLEKGYVTPQVLHAALAEQAITQERLGLILSRGGFISRATLLKAILATNPDMIHGESLFTARIPADILMGTRTMVVAEAAGKVYLATLESERQAAAEIKPYYPEAELVFVAADFEKVDSYLEQVRAMEQDDDSLVDKILRRAFADGVSDLHIVPRYDSYTIFSRYLGRRAHTHEGTLDEYNTLSARIKDLSRMDLAERRVPQDGGFQMEYNGKLVDLRVSAIPTGNSEYIVIRLLDPDRVQPSLDGLGVTRISEWRKGVSRPDGLCLIAGPTGSGKTSTLNASIREMDRFGSSIFTMEDPVEYRIPYVGQVNKNETLGLDFSRGIRAFMRSDPDVIVVGEIRDAETARNSIKAGETGHLVMGTLHTGSIFGVVARLRDLEVPQHELLYLLRSILVQRLIRTTCPHCKGEGCPACYHSGYGGRTVISECAYFSTEEDVKKLLAGERSWPTMLEDAVLKCKEGITTRKEVIRVFGEEAVMLFDKMDKGEA
jgi:type II secretory ATPase GspE/PulE/Tfp pilus assembly ATPase PilB-like protein